MRTTWLTGDAPFLRSILLSLKNRNRPENDAQQNEWSNQAQRLLADDVFNDAYGRVLERITDEIICTKAHESSRRDELHAEIRALHRVVHELTAMAAEAVVK